MQTTKEVKPENKDMENKDMKNPRGNKQKGSKAVHVDSTPVTQKVKPRAGTTLHDEGTNFSYDEQR